MAGSKENLREKIEKARRASPSGTLGSSTGKAGAKGSQQATGGGTTQIIYDPSSGRSAVVEVRNLSAQQSQAVEQGRKEAVRQEEIRKAEEERKETQRQAIQKKETAEQQALILAAAQQEVKASSQFAALRARRLSEAKQQIKEPTETTATLAKGKITITGEIQPFRKTDYITTVNKKPLEKWIKRDTNVKEIERRLKEDVEMKKELAAIEKEKEKLQEKYFVTKTILSPTLPGATAIPTKTTERKKRAIDIFGQGLVDKFTYERDIKKIEKREEAYLKKYYPVAETKSPIKTFNLMSLQKPIRTDNLISLGEPKKYLTDIKSEPVRKDLTAEAISLQPELKKTTTFGELTATVIGKKTSTQKAGSLIFQKKAIEAAKGLTTKTKDTETEQIIFSQLSEKITKVQREGLKKDAIDFGVIVGSVVAFGTLAPAISKIPIIKVVTSKTGAKFLIGTYAAGETINVGIGAYDISQGKIDIGTEIIGGTVRRAVGFSAGAMFLKSQVYKDTIVKLKSKAQFPETKFDYLISSQKKPTYYSRYEPQYQIKPILTESGKVIGYDLGLRQGQQVFSEKFTAPKIKTGKTESGIVVEIGRPRKNIIPAQTQKAVKEFIPEKQVDISISDKVIIIKKIDSPKPETFDIKKTKITPTKKTELIKYGIESPIKDKNIVSKIRKEMSMDSPFAKEMKNKIDLFNLKQAKSTKETITIQEKKPTPKIEIVKTEQPTAKRKIFSTSGKIVLITPEQEYYNQEPYFNLREENKIKSDIKINVLTQPEIKFTVLPSIKSNIFSDNKIKVNEKSKIKSKIISDTKLDISQKSKQDVIQRQDIMSKQDVIQRQDIIQKEEVIQDIIYKQKIVPEIIIPKIPKIKFPKKETAGRKERYNILVRRKGKFQRIGEAKSIKSAFRRGAFAVDVSAAASFKIQPIGSSKRIRNPFSYLSAKRFTTAKREPGVFVERSKFRISTPGERGEITAKGLFSLKQQRKTKNMYNIFSR